LLFDGRSIGQEVLYVNEKEGLSMCHSDT